MAIIGLEIDVLSLGDADSLLVTAWNTYPEAPSYVLIDGGRSGHAKDVRAFLTRRGITHLHSVVCTHLHDDHAAGLVELLSDTSLTVGQVAYHDPRDYVSEAEIKEALRKSAGSTEATVIEKSLQTVSQIAAVITERRIVRVAPFQGEWVQFLQVLSPSPTFYASLVDEFRSSDKILEVSKIYKSGATTLAGHILDGILDSSTLDEEPVTSPVNESSIVLGVRFDGQAYMFTADAGIRALNEVVQYCGTNVQGVKWMQIPHHGSRNNINPKLIEYFHPETSFVSAKGGDGHPSVAVVNAFKKVGARVYSTAYPTSGPLRYYAGQVPTRPEYLPATPLWDAKEDVAKRAAAANTLLVPAFRK